MRKFLFLSLVLFVPLTLSAQDKIITTSSDTILCRIISVSDNHIIYEQQADKHTSGKTIPLNDVAEYSRVSAVPPSTEMSSSQTLEQPWLLSLYVGGAHLPWLLESMGKGYAENDNYKKYANGFALNANAHYLVTQNVGLGVQYSFFTSGHKGTYPEIVGWGYPVYSNSDIRERQYINYVGISVIFRQFLDKNHKFSLSETLSGGLLLYRSESQSKSFMPSYYYYSGIIYSQYYSQYLYVSHNTLITGETFGATFGISAEYKILPYLSVGVGGSFMYGSLSKISSEYKDSMGEHHKIAGHELKTPFKLSRIDYSLVLRFNL